MAEVLTGVIVGFPKREPGNGRVPYEFVVLARIYPGWQYEWEGQPSIPALIQTYRATGKHDLVHFFPFELPEDFTHG